jgi:glycosyltransferase involved in cell wall biosynthesis
MKILLVNWATAHPDFAPRYRSQLLAEEWVRQGHDVTIVGGTFTHLHSREVHGEGDPIILESNGVRYIHLKVPTYEGSGIGRIKNIAAFVMQSRKHERYVSNFGPFDLVISATVYQIDNFSARRMAKRHRCPWFRETRDLWPLTLFEIGGISKKHPFAIWVQKGEDLACQRADLVISTLPDALQYLKTRGLPQNRFRWSPQSAAEPRSPQKSPPEEHLQLLEGLRAKHRKIAIMTGGLVRAINLPLLLEAAPMVEEDGVEIVLVGSGEMESLVRNCSARNVHLLPRVNQDCIPGLLARADFGVAGFNNLGIYKFGVSPNKVTEYLSHGLPVVLYVPKSRNLVDEANAGIVTDAESPENLAAALRKMSVLSVEDRQKLGASGKEFIEQHATIRMVAQSYINWQKEIIEGKAKR